MTRKDAMLRAIRGLPTDRIPWAPRLDLWFRSHQMAKTLPAKYRSATPAEMVDDLGWGFHAVIPDFRDLVGPLDDADRALGVYNLRAMPVRTVFENVERRVRLDGDRTRVEYVTPKGTLGTTTVYSESMLRAGITISHVEEHAFKGPEDYPAIGWIFENARVEPNFDGYSEFAARVGDRGIAVGFISASASPMHHVLRELMPYDRFFFETVDHPDELRELAEKVGSWHRRLTAVAPDAPAEVMLLGSNYDASLTWPPFFAEHIVPCLREFSGALHAKGKFLLSHTDGENTGLLDHYLDAGIDVADSICPAPMTKLAFGSVREAFGGRVTIMGGIPSIALIRATMGDADFARFLDDFFASLGLGDRLILGVSDTTPPDAEFDRLVEIARRIDRFGPVPSTERGVPSAG